MPGLDRDLIEALDFDLAFGRILTNIQTDLIVAPHYDYLYANGQALLAEKVTQYLSDGTYNPDLPISLAVPKPRGFNRPGGTLNPFDRVVYQLCADAIAESVEHALDRTRVFSTVLLDDDLRFEMFRRVGDSYSAFMQTVAERASRCHSFVKLDIANYYERVPQHAIINMLQGIGCDQRIVYLLEKLLLGLRQNQSYGIVQGLFPSDLIGNFFLSNFDEQCGTLGIESTRYVDDIYLTCQSYAEARRLLTWTIGKLRDDGLHLNELKSGIRGSAAIATEATEIKNRFIDTVNELRNSGLEEFIMHGYGFRVEPGVVYEVEDVDELSAAAAIRQLFDGDVLSTGSTAKIDSFAMPVLTALQNDMAVDRAIIGIKRRPYMAQVYAVYLSRFVGDDREVVDALVNLAFDDELGNYERMLVMAALQESMPLVAEDVRRFIGLLTDFRRPEAIRALAAIIAAKYGTAQQQRIVKTQYEYEASPYMRAALLYAARFFSRADRASCKRVWGAHSVTNSLIAATI